MEKEQSTKPQETTTGEFLNYIEKVMRMNMSEKKSSIECLFDLWKIYCDFYNCVVIKDDTFDVNYKVIEEINWKIRDCYQRDNDATGTLSEIMVILMQHRRSKFRKLNNIDEHCTKCKIGVVVDMCNHCFKLA